MAPAPLNYNNIRSSTRADEQNHHQISSCFFDTPSMKRDHPSKQSFFNPPPTLLFCLILIPFPPTSILDSTKEESERTYTTLLILHISYGCTLHDKKKNFFFFLVHLSYMPNLNIYFSAPSIHLPILNL
jgi:hypothetical protein